MAKPIPVPTLSHAGWVTSPAEKADALFSHWYESNKSQTLLYGSEVSNLQYLIEENGNNPISAIRAIRSELEAYLRRYYEAVNVEVSSAEPINSTNPKVELRVFIEVFENGKAYSFGKLLTGTHNKISQIIALNNTGTQPLTGQFN